jgi:hypothetical protein
MNPSSLPLLLVVTCLTSCTAWRLAPDRLDTPVPIREPVEIWSQGRNSIVHGVRLRGDTVRAVPRHRHPECDTCAIFFPLSEIDSVRSRRFSKGRTWGLAGASAVILLIYSLSQMPPTYAWQ